MIFLYVDDEHMSRSNSPLFTLPQPFAMLGDASRSSSSSNSSTGANANNSISSSSSMHQDIAAAAAAAAGSSSSRTTRGVHNSNTNYGRKCERLHHSYTHHTMACNTTQYNT
jgi:hypothetical protein